MVICPDCGLDASSTHACSEGVEACAHGDHRWFDRTAIGDLVRTEICGRELCSARRTLPLGTFTVGSHIP